MKDFDLWNGKQRKEDDDGRVYFGQRAKLWLAHALRGQITGTDEAHPKPAAEGEEVEALIEWYMLDPMRYVKWLPEASFRGKGYSVGAWVLDVEMVYFDVKQAREETEHKRQLAIDAAREFTSLEEWLDADLKGDLAYPGCQGGFGALTAEGTPAEQRNAAVSRRARWPRGCQTCGESFTPDRGRSRRCRQCIDAAKASVTPSKPRSRKRS